MRNYKISNVDTDAIMIYKEDESVWTELEQSLFLEELNAQFPEKIRFEHDGIFEKVIIAKAKNYILYDGKKIKTKGSAFKSSTKSTALRDFMNEVIKAIIDDKVNYEEIYNKYIRQIFSIKSNEEMKLWCTKKTLTDKVLESERTNEAKIRTALEESDYTEGDKFYVYYKEDDSLSLVEDFDGNYNKTRLLKNLFDTSKTFNTIIKDFQFMNYSLKRNKKLLEELVK